MTISPINTVTAYVPVPINSINFDDGVGIGQIPVPTSEVSNKNIETNASVNNNSTELLTEISKQYSFKSPIARLKESNTGTEKTKSSNNTKVGKTEEANLNKQEEGYSVEEVKTAKYNSGFVITMPSEHLSKVSANSPKLDDSSYNLKSMFNPSLRSMAGRLVNLML